MFKREGLLQIKVEHQKQDLKSMFKREGLLQIKVEHQKKDLKSMFKPLKNRT